LAKNGNPGQSSAISRHLTVGIADHAAQNNLSIPEIETTRLRLRSFMPDDLDDFASICSDREVMKHIGTGEPISRKEAELHMSGYVKYWAKQGLGRFAVTHKEHGELIGYCGFRLFRYPGLRLFANTPEIVFLRKKTSWGRGLAAEAARACLRYGFEQKKYPRVVAITRGENTASQRALERIGMKQGKNVHYMEFDCAVYSILLEEFQPGDFLYTLRNPS